MSLRLKNYLTIALLQALIPAVAHTQIQKIYLNPKAVTAAKQSLFVDSIRFIPLEIKEEKTVSFSNIEVTEKYLLLNDYNSKAVAIYTKQGRFLKKISYKYLGDSFSPSYVESDNKLVFFGNNKNYSLTARDLVKIRLDWSNPRNKKYFRKYHINLNDTAFVIEKDSPGQNDIIQAYPFYDDYYWQGAIRTSPLYTKGEDYEIKIFKDDKLVKGFFPYNRINEPKYLYAEESASFGKTDKPFVHYITRPYCDTVYKLIKDSMVPVYKMMLPLANSLPPTFHSVPFKNKTERDNFQRNNGWMMRQIYNFYETPELIFFSIRYFSNYDSYIYKKQGNITYKTKSIRPDSSQYNLQLLSDLNVLRKKDWFFKAQKAGDLIAFFDNHKNVVVPKELEEFLKSKPAAATPVIVAFKLKNTL